MKTELILATIIFLTWTVITFVAGDYLDLIEPDKPIIGIKPDSTLTHIEPLPPQHAEINISKPGKPNKPVKDSTVFIDSTSQIQTVYSELIDTVITFNSDSLDFVADIQFFDSTKTFKNTFDFQLRVKKIIEEVWREVPIPYKPEIYQEPLVIILAILTAFFGGLAL